eukprot:TRINITY_DN1422_c0_g4_i1.p1 TRINITY_DN1422_c0_g4~~TRINITY_DN1422_c0_g4_i1.p1  ORF type:complete len:636 (+),score=123.41 TRINITY_DN1422_c0_g4_i1:118-2025(+)
MEQNPFFHSWPLPTGIECEDFFNLSMANMIGTNPIETNTMGPNTIAANTMHGNPSTFCGISTLSVDLDTRNLEQIESQLNLYNLQTPVVDGQDYCHFGVQPIEPIQEKKELIFIPELLSLNFTKSSSYQMHREKKKTSKQTIKLESEAVQPMPCKDYSTMKAALLCCFNSIRWINKDALLEAISQMPEYSSHLDLYAQEIQNCPPVVIQVKNWAGLRNELELQGIHYTSEHLRRNLFPKMGFKPLFCKRGDQINNDLHSVFWTDERDRMPFWIGLEDTEVLIRHSNAGSYNIKLHRRGNPSSASAESLSTTISPRNSAYTLAQEPSTSSYSPSLHDSSSSSSSVFLVGQEFGQPRDQVVNPYALPESVLDSCGLSPRTNSTRKKLSNSSRARKVALEDKATSAHVSHSSRSEDDLLFLHCRQVRPEDCIDEKRAELCALFVNSFFKSYSQHIGFGDLGPAFSSADSLRAWLAQRFDAVMVDATQHNYMLYVCSVRESHAWVDAALAFVRLSTMPRLDPSPPQHSPSPPASIYGEGIVDPLHTHGELYVSQCVVHSDYQRRKIGTTLIRQTLRMVLREHPHLETARIFGCCRFINSAAMRLYEKLGARRCPDATAIDCGYDPTNYALMERHVHKHS